MRESRYQEGGFTLQLLLSAAATKPSTAHFPLLLLFAIFARSAKELSEPGPAIRSQTRLAPAFVMGEQDSSAEPAVLRTPDPKAQGFSPFCKFAHLDLRVAAGSTFSGCLCAFRTNILLFSGICLLIPPYFENPGRKQRRSGEITRNPSSLQRNTNSP